MKRLNDCMYRQICRYDQECTQHCKRYVLSKFLLDMSNIPKNKQGVNELTPSEQDKNAFNQLLSIKDNIEDFVDDGRMLYLWSDNTGNGKTTWSIKIALQYINAVWKYFHEDPVVVFISVPDFLMKSKSFNDNLTMKEISKLRRSAEKADLVILDDIGVDYISKYDYGIIFSLIDSLCLKGTAIIFTSNYSPKSLRDVVGDRLPSRICNDYVIELKGMDRRGQ